MKIDRYGYEFEHDDKYCYPNSNVLINKLDIRDERELLDTERMLTSLSLAELKVNPVEAFFDLDHLKRIHKFVFRDIYDWAGEIRTVNISKGNEFCRYEFIVPYAEDLFENLKKDNFLRDYSGDEFIKKLSYYFSEINVLHPFREGNGRVQRAFTQQLVNKWGYNIDFSDVSKDEMIEASDDAFNLNYSKLEKMFSRILSSFHSE